MNRGLLFVLLIPFIAIVGCETLGTKNDDETDINKRDVVSYRYLPILPMPVPRGLMNADKDEFAWKDNASALELLENEALRAFLGREESSGSFSYVMANSDAEITSGIYMLDSVRYTAVPYLLPGYDEICRSKDADTKHEACDEEKWTSRVAFLLVGVGARAEIKFSSKSGSFDASTILSVGAEDSDIEGSINLSSIGVTSASISPLLSVSPNLSTENIESTLRSLEVVKMIATFSGNTEGVDINPQILAIDPGDMPMDVLLEDIYKAILEPKFYEKRLEKSGVIEST